MKQVLLLSPRMIELYGGIDGDVLKNFTVVETKPIPMSPKAPIVGNPWPPRQRR